MTTFQGLVYALLFSLGEFLPIGGEIYAQSFAKFIHTDEAQVISYAFHAFGFLALITYFINDWASILSSGIQVIIFRRKPAMIDERLFFFLSITAGIGIAGHFAFEWFQLGQFETFTIGSALVVALTAVFWFVDGWSKRSKSLCDFGWIDSIWMGLCCASGIFLGVGWMTAGILGLMFRNYKREAALKLSLLAMTPYFAFLALRSIHSMNWDDSHPLPNTTWVTLAVSGVASYIIIYSTLGNLLTKIEDKTYRPYSIYRMILGVALLSLSIWKEL